MQGISIRAVGRVAVLTVALFLCTVASASGVDGNLDPSFGSGGRVATNKGSPLSVNAVAIDSHGRIVAAGQGGSKMALVRYLPTGVLDTSFSDDGIAIFDPGNGDYASAQDVAIDRQGRILAAGCVADTATFGIVACDDFALIRVSDGGALDSSFGAGSNGFVTKDFAAESDSASAVGVDDQGRIVVGGTAQVGGDDDFGVLRYLSTGNLDPSFGTGGKATVDFTPVGNDDDRVQAMAIDAQDRVVLAGNSTTPSTNGFALARLRADGSRDASFGNAAPPGSEGQVTTPIGSASSTANALTIDPQGRILGAGVASDGATNQFALARYSADGSLDPTFSDDGKVTTSIGGEQSAAAMSVGLDFQGRIVATGSGTTSGRLDLALARYTPSGGLDQTFGGGGTMTSPSGLGVAASIDGQDRIVIADQIANAVIGEPATDAHFGVARFIGDATAPTISLSSGPADGSLTNDPRPTFEFSSSEDGATFGCGLDGLASACTSPFTPPARLSDGKHTFSLTATDRAGNTSAATTRTFTVDTEAPEIDIKGKKKVKTHRKKARDKLKIETSEPSKLTCQVDNKKPEECVAKFITPKLKKGKHKVTVTATDQAGNSSDEAKKIKVVRKP